MAGCRPPVRSTDGDEWPDPEKGRRASSTYNAPLPTYPHTFTNQPTDRSISLERNNNDDDRGAMAEVEDVGFADAAADIKLFGKW